MARSARSGPRPRSADVRNRLGRDARKSPYRAGFFTGRDRRAAASPGAERSVRRRKTNRKASVFFPFVPPCRAGASQRDALYLLWMAESHDETRSRIKIFYRAATPHFNSLSRPNAPGRDRRAAASPGAEHSVRRRKIRRKASVLFPFVPPCWAGASQRDALYLLRC